MQARHSALTAHLIETAWRRILELRKPCGIHVYGGRIDFEALLWCTKDCHAIRHAVRRQETQAQGSKSCDTADVLAKLTFLTAS